MTAQILLGILIGIFVCAALFGFYFALQIAKSVKSSVDELTKATRELLAEGSFTRISKSLAYITKNADDWMRGMGEFARLMSIVGKQVFSTEKVDEVAKQAVGESAFFPGVTDTEAMENEVTREAGRHGIALTEEQMKGMRTEDVT